MLISMQIAMFLFRHATYNKICHAFLTVDV